MSGNETLDRLKELDPSVRAIVCSGYSNDPVMAHYETYGFKACLAKPFDSVELSDTIHKLLDG